jgi:hypothetical protein
MAQWQHLHVLWKQAELQQPTIGANASCWMEEYWMQKIITRAERFSRHADAATLSASPYFFYEKSSPPSHTSDHRDRWHVCV